MEEEGARLSAKQGEAEVCRNCGVRRGDTPMMRRGPAGPRTLCNACGLRWKKSESSGGGADSWTASPSGSGSPRPRKRKGGTDSQPGSAAAQHGDQELGPGWGPGAAAESPGGSVKGRASSRAAICASSRAASRAASRPASSGSGAPSRAGGPFESCEGLGRAVAPQPGLPPGLLQPSWHPQLPAPPTRPPSAAGQQVPGPTPAQQLVAAQLLSYQQQRAEQAQHAGPRGLFGPAWQQGAPASQPLTQPATLPCAPLQQGPGLGWDWPQQAQQLGGPPLPAPAGLEAAAATPWPGGLVPQSQLEQCGDWPSGGPQWGLPTACQPGMLQDLSRPRVVTSGVPSEPMHHAPVHAGPQLQPPFPHIYGPQPQSARLDLHAAALQAWVAHITGWQAGAAPAGASQVQPGQPAPPQGSLRQAPSMQQAVPDTACCRESVAAQLGTAAKGGEWGQHISQLPGQALLQRSGPEIPPAAQALSPLGGAPEGQRSQQVPPQPPQQAQQAERQREGGDGFEVQLDRWQSVLLEACTPPPPAQSTPEPTTAAGAVALVSMESMCLPAALAPTPGPSQPALPGALTSNDGGGAPAAGPQWQAVEQGGEAGGSGTGLAAAPLAPGPGLVPGQRGSASASCRRVPSPEEVLMQVSSLESGSAPWLTGLQ